MEDGSQVALSERGSGRWPVPRWPMAAAKPEQGKADAERCACRGRWRFTRHELRRPMEAKYPWAQSPRGRRSIGAPSVGLSLGGMRARRAHRCFARPAEVTVGMPPPQGQATTRAGRVSLRPSRWIAPLLSFCSGSLQPEKPLTPCPLFLGSFRQQQRRSIAHATTVTRTSAIEQQRPLPSSTHEDGLSPASLGERS